jgi:NAD(P)H dehydrogenase (quinone)
VNPGFFADNYMAALEPMAQFGLMAMPLGDGLNAPPSNEDIARVVAGALTDPCRHVGKTYRPTGPRLLAPDEIADTFGKVLGRRVRYRNAPLKLFLKVAKSMGYGDYLISQLRWFLLDYQRNSFGLGAPTDAVLEVGGSPPEDFEQIVRRYVATSRSVKATIGAKVPATFRLMKALLTPAPNLAAIVSRFELPSISHAALAADSASWLRSHGCEGALTTTSRSHRPASQTRRDSW